MDTINEHLKIQFNFLGNKSGKTKLMLPDRWANQENLYQAIHSLKCLNKNVKLLSEGDSTQLILQHKPGQKIDIEYFLKQDWKGDLSYPKNYRGIVNNTFFHYTGYSLFVLPKFDDTTYIHVDFDWRGLPKNWNIANSFHTISKKIAVKTTPDNLLNAIYVAGDYRIHTSFINQKPIYFAIRGKDWKFSDQTALDIITKVIQVERDFWKDHTENYYLVTMTPFSGQGSINGSALHQSFLTGMTTEFPFDLHLYGLIAHEYFHRWNGVEFHMEGKEQENAWFGEGFTEYYTYKLLYKGKLISLQQYIEKTNQTIADYYLSPVKNDSIYTLGTNFWGNRDYQMLPYKKGFAYALYLDQLISKQSLGQRSLDDLLFLIRIRISKAEKLSEELFLNVLNSILKKDLTQEHREYIHNGKTIPILSGSLGDEIKDSIQQLAAFELGFDFNRTSASNKISGVKENSNAWKAGLRDGQIWRGGSIYFDKPDMEALVIIEENGEEKKISYYPKSSNVIEVRQFYL